MPEARHEELPVVTIPPTQVLQGTIHTGDQFHTVISEDMIVLRVGDRVCMAGPRWLTLDQAERVRTALETVLR